jgi:DNA-binding XRE family transcriptional regulator
MNPRSEQDADMQHAQLDSEIPVLGTPLAPGFRGAQETLGLDHPATVLPLAEFSQLVQHLNPPFAYRLSLDSGVEFNNVKHAFDDPLGVRLGTLLRLLKSFGVSLVAARSREDVATMDPSVPRVILIAAGGATLSGSQAATLRECRQLAGMSMAALSARAGVSVDTVTAIERGQGLMRNVARMCEELGLSLFVVLPPPHATVDALWAARADGFLTAPAQFPPRRPTRARRASEGEAGTGE